MNYVSHMTPEGLLELELQDGALVWPPESTARELLNAGSPKNLDCCRPAPSKLSLMIQVVSAACAPLNERC
jgi:hypothetical protein